jgi:hypothetical protein
MPNPPRWVLAACLAQVVALYVVGAVSHGVLRHAVQTLPLWVPIALAMRRNELAKWTALPCLFFWLLIMTLIWLFLLGWVKFFSGHFSVVEIAMTVVVALAAVAGMAAGLRWRTSTAAWKAACALLGMAALQVLAMRISFLPGIADC